MPRLEPFAAVRFDAAPGGDVSSRIAPPYDVLDEGPKRELLSQDPHNIVAIDLPVTPPKTVGPEEAYERAGATYRRWLAEGVLVRDDQPAVYAYEQRYTAGGQPIARRGLFAALGLEPFNQPRGIYRHEMTFPGGVDDRYKLTAATGAQLSPIFGVFSDPGKRVAGWLAQAFEKREPDFHGETAHDGVVHRVWRVTEDRIIASLQAFFEQTEVFIADGHHRYTTALKFSQDHADLPGAGRCLFDLVAAEDRGMIVRPTHRVVVGMDGFTMERLKAEVAGRDDLALARAQYGSDQLDALAKALTGFEEREHAMGLYDPGTGQTFFLTTTSPDPLARALPERPAVWRTLDVAIFQELVMGRLLKPTFGGEGVGYQYTAEAAEVRGLCDADPGRRLGALMRPTALASVMGVSLAGELMPAKSTYFYPKLATGLVVHPLR